MPVTVTHDLNRQKVDKLIQENCIAHKVKTSVQLVLMRLLQFWVTKMCADGYHSFCLK
jgi:hypothetical protein